MSLRISFEEAVRRVREAKSLSDIKALFQDIFGAESVEIDEGAEAESFKQILGVDQEYPIYLAKAAKLANPNFRLGGGYTKNCQRCIAVFEMRRRGYPVIALPKLTSAKIDGIFSSQSCFKNPVIIGKRGGRSQPALDKTALLEQLENLPEGARAAICWTWQDQGQKGHTIACEKQNGIIIFVDPQSGNLGESVLGRADQNGYSFFRMDNLEFDCQKFANIAVREKP